MSAFQRWTGPTPKPSRTARKKNTIKATREKVAKEDAEKQKVRRREQHRCRWPLCGCRKLRLNLEVSHDNHKGMGSKDDVSTADQMVLLCNHRHQHGRVSRHAGTMKAEYLTADGYNGPVAWYVDMREIALDTVSKTPIWLRVATESAPGKLEPTTPHQREVLLLLAAMDI